jgi:5-methylcytosine-specific restriction enzyme A
VWMQGKTVPDVEVDGDLMGAFDLDMALCSGQAAIDELREENVMSDEAALEQVSDDMREAREAKRAARPTPAQPYKDWRWQERARAFLLAHPHCLGCVSVGVTTPAVVADHVTPKSRSEADFLTAPLQPLCARCHNFAKRTLENAYRRGECVQADLRMDSPRAVALIAAKMPCTVDGWPTNPGHPWYRKPK